MKKKGLEKILTNTNEKILMLWADKGKVDGKRSPLKFFLVNILYLNSFTLESELFSS